MKILYIFVVCLVLAVAGLSRANSEETECFAVFMEGKKIGHAIQSRVVADGKVTTTEKVSMQVSRADVPVSMNTTETSIETTDGKPPGFEVVQDYGMMTMNVSGEVDEGGTASMCRAVGIPARVVSGLVYVKEFAGRENMFGGHMWVEAYVGDKWIGLDATRAPKGFDAGHITLATGNGEPADFFNLLNFKY